MKEPTLYNVSMTNADTEYSQALPAGTTAVEIHLRDHTAFRVAWETGKVATPTEPYKSVPAGHAYYQEGMNPRHSYTLYFASASAGKTAEIEVWKGT